MKSITYETARRSAPCRGRRKGLLPSSIMELMVLPDPLNGGVDVHRCHKVDLLRPATIGFPRIRDKGSLNMLLISLLAMRECLH